MESTASQSGAHADSAGDRTYFPSVDGWRAIAIAMVMATHMVEHSLGVLFELGPTGVQLFFCISGFLIGTLLLKEKTATGTISFVRFFGRRAFRVLPAAYLYLLVVEGLGLLGWTAVEQKEVAAAAMFYLNYYHCFIEPWYYYTAHFWSLAVEEQFYVAAPLLFAITPRKGLLILFAGLALACGAWRGLDARFGLSQAYIHPGLHIDIHRMDQCFDYLAWGVVLAIVLSDPARREWIRGRLSLGVRVALFVAFVSAIYLPIPAKPIIFGMLTPCCLACTILRTEGFFSRALELSPIRWVGRLSYSLYLWQQLFLAAFAHETGPLASVQSFPVNFLLTLLLAASSYYVVETPVRRWGYQWIDRIIPATKRRSVA